MEPLVILTIYNAISLLIVVILLIIVKKLIKQQKIKDIILKVIATLVVVIHFSGLYFDFFSNDGVAMIEDNLLLPIYPCNIVMWCLLIVAFFKKKETVIYKYLSHFTAFGGTICGLIGVLFNMNFLATPDFNNFHIVKGLLSHTVMVLGTLYLIVLKYVKIDAKNTFISCILGTAVFTINGLFINTLFKVCNIPSVNAMFMLEAPLEMFPYLNFYTICSIAIIGTFIFLNLYEIIFVPNGKRWLFNTRKK